MKRLGIIYKCTSPSGKCYIGKTIRNLEERIYSHINDSLRYDYAFSRAIKKYGKDNLCWEILYSGIDEDLLSLAEICAIYTHDSYYNGYNSSVGGEGTIGYVFTKDQRKKLSLSRVGERNHMFGKNHSLVSKFKMSEAKIGENNSFYGKKHTDETKLKIRISSLGRKHTEESRAKMSKKQSGKNHPMYGKNHSVKTKECIAIKNGGKPFVIKKDDIVLDKFVSIRECARSYNLQRTNISACLNKRQITHRGFTFAYINDSENT